MAEDQGRFWLTAGSTWLLGRPIRTDRLAYIGFKWRELNSLAIKGKLTATAQTASHPAIVGEASIQPFPLPYRARQGSCVEPRKAMDGIGADVDERDWATRALPVPGAPHARLMNEQFVHL